MLTIKAVVEKFYRIIDSIESRNRWHLGAPRDQNGAEIDPRVFTAARRYAGSEPVNIAVKQGQCSLDFTLGSFDMPVVRVWLGQALLESAAKDIQLVKALVDGDDDFVVLNVLSNVDAIDEGRSEITRWTEEDGRPEKVGTYFGIGKMAIRTDKVQSAQMFRLKQWELPLIVSNSIKSVLQTLKVTGIDFEELS